MQASGFSVRSVCLTAGDAAAERATEDDTQRHVVDVSLPGSCSASTRARVHPRTPLPPPLQRGEVEAWRAVTTPALHEMLHTRQAKFAVPRCLMSYLAGTFAMAHAIT